jgi:membrane-bound serine protease (ClpP class)
MDTILFFSLAIGIALLMIVVVALWVHKRARVGVVKLIGEIGQVDTSLDPEGTVMVHGELWLARSRGSCSIPALARVRVVGFEGHYALVEVCD